MIVAQIVVFSHWRFIGWFPWYSKKNCKCAIIKEKWIVQVCGCNTDTVTKSCPNPNGTTHSTSLFVIGWNLTLFYKIFAKYDVVFCAQYRAFCIKLSGIISGDRGLICEKLVVENAICFQIHFGFFCSSHFFHQIKSLLGFQALLSIDTPVARVLNFQDAQLNCITITTLDCVTMLLRQILVDWRFETLFLVWNFSKFSTVPINCGV